MCWMVNRSAVLRCSMAVEFWTRRQPVTSYPSKGKGRNNPFSFENFKTFVGGLSHTVAFAFGTRVGYIVKFKADTRTKDTTLIATFDTGDTYDILWNVVQPTGERASKTGDLSYAAGIQGAGMTIKYTTLPDDVSFYNVEMLEVDKGTSNVTGFFTPFAAALLKHNPNPNWGTLFPDNHWDDTAGFDGWGFPPSSGHPRSWAYGTYQWAIDVMWRTVGEGGNGVLLGTRMQLHTLHDGTGRSTESKSGESSTRTP